MSNKPVDPKLYESVKRRVKRRVKVWPSAYASGQLVNEYKEEFSRKYGFGKNPYMGKRSGEKPLERWYREDWRDVCKVLKSGEYAKCGRESASMKAKDYPYCRPLNRISKSTPKTVDELTDTQIKKMCKKKKKSMRKSRGKQTRVYLKRKTRKRNMRKRSTRRKTRKRKTRRKTRKRSTRNRKTRKRSTRRKTRKRKTHKRSTRRKTRKRSSRRRQSGGGGGKKLPSGTKFTKGKGRYKYTVKIPIKGKIKTVHFGAKGYEHFKDSVPKRLGGKLWSHKDHLDKKRRENYRKRHGGIKVKSGKSAISVKYSPAWFSYYFLW